MRREREPFELTASPNKKYNFYYLFNLDNNSELL
jgi:hypothetical protein